MERLLEGGLDGHGVHHGVHGHAAQRHLLLQGDAQLVEGLDELGVHVVQRAGAVLLLRRGVGVVRYALVVNLRDAQMGPRGHVHRQPVAVGLQAEVQQPGGLAFLFGDEAHGVLREAAVDDVGVHVGGEAVLVLLFGQLLYVFVGVLLLLHVSNI